MGLTAEGTINPTWSAWGGVRGRERTKGQNGVVVRPQALDEGAAAGWLILVIMRRVAWLILVVIICRRRVEPPDLNRIVASGKDEAVVGEPCDVGPSWSNVRPSWSKGLFVWIKGEEGG